MNLNDVIDGYRRMLANDQIANEARLKIFAEAAADIASYGLREGAAKPDIVDPIEDIARASEYFGKSVDEIQALITRGFECAEEEQREAEQRQQSNGHDKAAAHNLALPLIFFADLTDQPSPKPWLIKGVIARDETSSWIGPPGAGKSALLTDIAVHKGAGFDWRGFRTKGASGVVYFALERADLVRRRLIAHRQRDGHGDLPIAVASKIIDLLNPNCVGVILDTIHAAEDHFAHEVGLVIFDTYAKGIAAGGGDEDKAKDQNIVQANLRRIFDRGCHIHIAGIGHTGKDESRGERGSNARLADVDLQVQITGGPVKTATVRKANDQPEGPLTSFKLEPFEFGPDEDGDPFRTFILSPEGYASERGASRQKPTNRQLLALRALAEVTLSAGHDPPADYRLPPGVKVAQADTWQEELLRRNVIEKDTRNPRARFRELRNSLAARNLIGSRDDLVWAVALSVGPAYET
jgi:hypothetical protein